MQLSDTEKYTLKKKATQLHRRMFTTRTHDESIGLIEEELVATYKEAKKAAQNEPNLSK